MLHEGSPVCFCAPGMQHPLSDTGSKKQTVVGWLTDAVCPVHDSVGAPAPLLPFRLTGAGCSSGRLDAMKAESSLSETIRVNLEADQEATRCSCK